MYMNKNMSKNNMYIHSQCTAVPPNPIRRVDSLRKAPISVAQKKTFIQY